MGDLPQLRGLVGALLLGVLAAGVEVAPRRRVGRARHLALERLGLVPVAWVGLRHRGQQRLRVRVQRPRVQLLRVGDLDHPADVHHHHPVGDVLHHRQVVADEQVGQPQSLLQVLQQVDDLGLHRDVQRRHGLVADDQVGVQGQRPGDADALPLPAGERVRVAARVLRAQPDDGQQLGDPVAQRLPLQHLVDDEGLGDHPADGHPGVQRGHRVLEDELHPRADRVHRLGVGVLEVHRAELGVAEDDLAAGGFLQPDDGPPGGGLAAAGLADDGHRLTAVDAERHPVDGLHVADHAAQRPALDGEVLLQAPHLQQRALGRLGLAPRRLAASGLGHRRASVVEPAIACSSS